MNKPRVSNVSLSHLTNVPIVLPPLSLALSLSLLCNHCLCRSSFSLWKMEPAKIDWKTLDSRFVEDELYEHIHAPQWVDFNAPQEFVDDEAWFCRPGKLLWCLFSDVEVKIWLNFGGF